MPYISHTHAYLGIDALRSNNRRQDFYARLWGRSFSLPGDQQEKARGRGGGEWGRGGGRKVDVCREGREIAVETKQNAHKTQAEQKQKGKGEAKEKISERSSLL